MPECYRIDSRKLTLREYWNMEGSWKVVLPWVLKLLRVRVSFLSGFKQFDSLSEVEVAEGEHSTAARETLAPLLDEALRFGFYAPRFFSFETLRRETRTCFVSLLHRSGQFSLRLMHTLSTTSQPPVVNVTVALMSELDDGTYFFTSNQRPKFFSPPGVVSNRLVGASLERLMASHEAELARLQMRNPARPVASQAALDQGWERYEKHCLDYYVRRGLYVAMKPEEVASALLPAPAAAPTSPTTPGLSESPDAAVLAEVDRLQRAKGGWGNAILIFVVSMALFVGVGSQQWSWETALMLVPILLFHELGHYVAMRAFHYRNLRMFFIPFFGAAVTGQHYNVPGWKKVIVFLMGPVPGIALGVIVGGAGMVLHLPILTKLAIFTLILNGLNLLPVLPLDGGWVCHTLLFSRHPYLDTAFRVVAVIALATWGLLGGSRIFLYLSIPMALGIPTAYRLARIAANLRQRGVPPASPDDQTIPPETAQEIIGELKAAFPGTRPTTMIARHTLQVFETLNARPPGWPATVSLLAAHGLSVGMAAVFIAVLVVGRRGFQPWTAAALFAPKYEVGCETPPAWRGTGPGAPAGSYLTLVATFPKRRAAELAFRSLTNRVPATGVLKRFGQTLLLSLPADQDAARKEWLAELQGRTREAFVDSTNFQANVSFSCRAPNEHEAEELEQELEEYLGTRPDKGLIPPWAPRDIRAPEQRARDHLARRTYLLAFRASGQADDGVETGKLWRQVVQAQKRGDLAEARELSQRIQRLADEARKRALAALRQGARGPVDTNVLDLIIALPASPSGTNQAVYNRVMAEMVERMGRLPGVEGRVGVGDDRFCARSGGVSRKGRVITIQWLSFRRTSEGAPALAEWLCGKGCLDLKYDIQSGLGSEEPDEEQ